jgi:hypothetical protein
MAAFPGIYYEIIPCCPDFGTQVTFFNSINGDILDGTYSYEGTTTVINGIQFRNGYCYTIIRRGVSFQNYPDIDYNFLNPIVDGCTDLKCPTCPTYYTFNDCCTNEPFRKDGKILVFEYQIGECNPGACPADMEGLVITELYPECVPPCVPEVQGCFNLTVISAPPVDSTVVDWFIIADFNYVIACEQCQQCATYYTLNDCCSNEPYKVEGDIVYIAYTNECEPGVCPTNLENLVITEILNEAGLPVTGCFNLTEVTLPALANTIYPWELFVQEVSTVQTCAECQECCYTLTNCETEEVIYSNSNTLIQHFGNIVTLNGQEGCWAVALSEGDCTCPIPVTVLQSFEDCPSCVPIIAYKFTNCNNQTLVQYSTEDYSAYVGKTVELECGDCWFVSQIDYIPPSTQTITILYTFDSCIACNRTYYKLTDCLDPNNVTYTYTDLSSLTPTPIAGCDCISVTYTLEGGEPVTVEVELTSIPSIDGALGYEFEIGGVSYIIAYNIVSENTWACFSVFGTSQATLSEDTECPFGIYTIEVGSIFEAFEVEPCSSLPVIKIKGCDTCFTVEETREPINAGIVELVDSFIDCPECLETFPCICNRITNQDTIAKDFIYLDCSFEEVTINLQPNETSDKICLISWVLTPEEEALVYIEHFGNCNGGDICYNYAITIGSNTTAALYYKNCNGAIESQQTLSQRSPYIITICGINNQTSSDIYIVGSGSMSFEKTTTCATQPFTCPAEPLPKRKVKPGYSTPSCDIEKYEKITCKSSEIYYKQVMRRRYGISNCCPEEEEKWLIKKELIDLDALRDPDYICTPVTSCCGQTIETCGCGCNQTLKTCNS